MPEHDGRELLYRMDLERGHMPKEAAVSHDGFYRLQVMFPEVLVLVGEQKTLIGIPLVRDASIPTNELHLRYSDGTTRVVNIWSE